MAAQPFAKAVYVGYLTALFVPSDCGSPVAACLAFSAAIDIFVTGILFVFLIRSRSMYTQSGFASAITAHQYHLGIGDPALRLPPPCSLAALIARICGASFVTYWAVLLQTILGKLDVISLFVTLEGRAKLAEVANLTHFPTVTNANRLDRRWSSVARDDSDHTDPTQGSQLPVHVSRPARGNGEEGILIPAGT
ncbi:hypothetical protein H4582DRAFT_792728 [Lactarius indigo]|nr:hypothetical protein H4582DRAFT_792728 [Lactarius indigo]